MAKEANAFSREMIMKEYIDMVRQKYDFIIIDCMPSLGMMTINALASSDSVLVPIITAYLSVMCQLVADFYCFDSCISKTS